MVGSSPINGSKVLANDGIKLGPSPLFIEYFLDSFIGQNRLPFLKQKWHFYTPIISHFCFNLYSKLVLIHIN